MPIDAGIRYREPSARDRRQCAMSRKSPLGRIIFIALVTVSLGTLLSRAVLEIMRGNGAGTYENVYGMPIHWITVLTFSASLLAAAHVALAIRWWQKRDDRTIDRLLRAKRK